MAPKCDYKWTKWPHRGLIWPLFLIGKVNLFEWPLCWLMTVTTVMATQAWHGKEFKDFGRVPRVPVKLPSACCRGLLLNSAFVGRISQLTDTSQIRDCCLLQWRRQPQRRGCFWVDMEDELILFVDTATMWLPSNLRAPSQPAVSWGRWSLLLHFTINKALKPTV